MSADPINQIAETLAESLYHVTTHVAAHTGIAMTANHLVSLSQDNEPQEDTLYNRAASWLSPFPKVKKALTFLGLEGLTHLAKNPASRVEEKFTPTAKKFFTPIIRKVIEPALKRLQEQGLIVVQDPIEAAKTLTENGHRAAEHAKKLQEATLSAVQATQAAAHAIKSAAQAAAHMEETVAEISAKANAPWIPEWIMHPAAPEWLKTVDIFGLTADENTTAPILPTAADQAAQQTQSLINQAIHLAQTAANKAHVTLEATQKVTADLAKEISAASLKKVAQAANMTKEAGNYIRETIQDPNGQEISHNPVGVAAKLLQRLEKNSPQAGKSVADLFEKGAQGYHYSTSIAGSLVENVGEALGVSNPVALGILATAGILSYWGLKSGYNYMISSTTVTNVNNNHNTAHAQPVVNVINIPLDPKNATFR